MTSWWTKTKGLPLASFVRPPEVVHFSIVRRFSFRFSFIYLLLLIVVKNQMFMKTAAMLLYLNNGTTAKMVYPTNPPGIELYYHANIYLCFGEKTRLLITLVKTLYISFSLYILFSQYRSCDNTLSQEVWSYMTACTL